MTGLEAGARPRQGPPGASSGSDAARAREEWLDATHQNDTPENREHATALFTEVYDQVWNLGYTAGYRLGSSDAGSGADYNDRPN